MSKVARPESLWSTMRAHWERSVQQRSSGNKKTKMREEITSELFLAGCFNCNHTPPFPFDLFITVYLLGLLGLPPGPIIIIIYGLRFKLPIEARYSDLVAYESVSNDP